MRPSEVLDVEVSGPHLAFETEASAASVAFETSEPEASEVVGAFGS